jgi:hypothetical protein
MTTEKPKSIKTTGLLISVISTMFIFSNTMGAFAFMFIGFGGKNSIQNKDSEFKFIDFLFYNIYYLFLVIIILGGLFLIGGLNIRKYKLWANRLVSILSMFSILIIWSLMLSLSTVVYKEGISYSLVVLFFSFILSIPFVYLFWFLNRKINKMHFN